MKSEFVGWTRAGPGNGTVAPAVTAGRSSGSKREMAQARADAVDHQIAAPDPEDRCVGSRGRGGEPCGEVCLEARQGFETEKMAGTAGRGQRWMFRRGDSPSGKER